MVKIEVLGRGRMMELWFSFFFLGSCRTLGYKLAGKWRISRWIRRISIRGKKGEINVVSSSSNQ